MGKYSEKTAEQRKHLRDYHREWQRANKDKTRAYYIRYWKKKIAEEEMGAVKNED